MPEVHKQSKISVPLVCVNSKIVPSVDSTDRGQIEYSTFSNKDYYILGKGSFGTVILANYKGDIVAAKVINRSHKRDEMCFRNEHNLLKLSHSNIVQVIKIICDNSSLGFVLMEPLSPTTLQNVISSNILIPLGDKVRYLLDISEAILHCHEHQILHLDIKPKNVLVNEITKVCKLCDFGNSLDTSKSKLSCQWEHQGTVVYSAPELLKGEYPTEKTDVYSLGITIWQVLHEETPFYGLSAGCLIYQVVSANTRPLSNKKVVVNEYKALYEKCWHSIPNLRPTMPEIVLYFRKITVIEALPEFSIETNSI